MSQMVSVIIPVYNDEKYLMDCVNSVLNQTYQNLEVILVNDGSTDRSAALCEQLRAQDSRVRVLHKPNGGVGDSRNAGLAMATGELLAFVDNDDRMEPTNLAELVDLLERCQADIAIGNFYEFGEADQTFYFRVREVDYYEKVYTPAEWFAEEYNIHFNLSQCFTVPWGKVYKRELFDQIAYPNDRAVEDDLTTWQVYLLADRIAFMNKALNMHRKRASSVTQETNQANVYPLEAIEQRVTMMALLGMDITEELKAYRWRLKVHRDELLKSGSTNLVKYKNVVQRLRILKKAAKKPLD